MAQVVWRVMVWSSGGGGYRNRRFESSHLKIEKALVVGGHL